MSKLDRGQEKLLKNAVASTDEWISMLKDARSREAFISGVADTDPALSKSDVRAAIHTKNWRDFASNPRDYVDDFEDGLRAAIEADKWKKKYIGAFSG